MCKKWCFDHNWDFFKKYRNMEHYIKSVLLIVKQKMSYFITALTKQNGICLHVKFHDGEI